jgi:hypothetical protein
MIYLHRVLKYTQMYIHDRCEVSTYVHDCAEIEHCLVGPLRRLKSADADHSRSNSLWSTKMTWSPRGNRNSDGHGVPLRIVGRYLGASYICQDNAKVLLRRHNRREYRFATYIQITKRGE